MSCCSIVRFGLTTMTHYYVQLLSVLVKKFVTEQNELSRMLAVDVALQTVENMTTKDAQK